MQYNDTVIEHFFNPRNVGVFEDDTGVFTSRLGSMHVGEQIQLQIRVNQQQQLESARFKVYGNPYAIAACSYFTEWARGKSMQEVSEFDVKALIKELEIPQARLHSVLRLQDAIKQVVAKANEEVCA